MRLAALGLVAAAIAGCSLIPSGAPAGPTPPPNAAVVPPAAMTLNLSNGSTLDVALVVDGTVVAQVRSHDGAELTAARLPQLPWTVEVRSPTGRVLVAMTVHAGDVWSAPVEHGGTQVMGAAARVDLSCGRIEVWSGPPLFGPEPGPGVPGDCVP